MNEIVAENQLPGAPDSEWDLKDRPGDPWGVGDSTIQGFATDISMSRGGTVSFKIRTDATAYHLDVYRLGFYDGLGARKVATVAPSVTLPQPQPLPLTDPATGLIDCGNWALSASWDVPADAVSGIYVAKLVRDDGVAGANHIHFIVRRDDGDADILFQTSDTTWQAYNAWGDRSLYAYGGPLGDPLTAVGRAYAVSYNRPIVTRGHEWGSNFLFNAEYPMVRWLEANGFAVDYCAGVDVDRFGSSLLQHKVFMSVGHDEYWSARQRANVEAARDAGVHLAFCSGNEMYWRIRWAPSADATSTPYRTIVCCKETHADRRLDPSGEWTGTWRDPRFGSESGGGRPENALSGTLSKRVAGISATAVQVPPDYATHRFWRNTELVTRPNPVLAVGTLGYEWDEDLDNGWRPAGLAHLSATTEDWNPEGKALADLQPVERTFCLQDQGTTFTVGTAAHHVTLYRHASGALVFSAGTVQWARGLDADHDTQGRHSGNADPAMRQAMVNLLADMGVQPGSIQADLVFAAASTDVTPPLSVITAPVDGMWLVPGQPTTITGTARDAEGVVAAVEVSVNGGVSWRPAQGRETWSFTWTPTGNGRVRLVSRAVDDSGNLEIPTSGVEIEVGRAIGAPILLVVDASYRANPFGDYLTEILRGEGLAGFQKIELRELGLRTDPLPYLRSFAVVLLAEMRFSAEQQELVRMYVVGGGSLVAMRPDPALADLFGLAFVAERLDRPDQPLQFLAFDTAAGLGLGIASESLPYHGSTDLYTVAGATPLAWLWDDLETPSTHPAASIYANGAGRAAAFTFDVSKDIVLSRQGNPDWKNSEGDGAQGVKPGDLGTLATTNAQCRPMDMFARLPKFDAAGVRLDAGKLWFEPARLRIPHADEKQRFLANLLLTMIGRPTPRLWYLPGLHRAVIVNTGDGEEYDEATLNQPIADAASHGGWFTAYLRRLQIPWPPHAGIVSPMTDQAWRASGHEVGVHVHNSDVDGIDIQTYKRLWDVYHGIANALQNAYGHGPRTARSHTIDWVGWVDMARIEAEHGTRLDMNYYHYWQFASATAPTRLVFPPGDPRATGYFTGSGLPQRFCDESGTILPIFQLLTEWPDEFFYNNGYDPDRVFSDVIGPMLERAEDGYVSAFANNVHPGPYWTPATGYNTGYNTERWVHAMWNHAQAAGIPMLAAQRLLDFVEARTGGSFDHIAWSGTVLTFEFATPAGGHDETIMLPDQGLRSIQVDDVAVPFSHARIAGREYALFTINSAAAHVVATYWRTWIETTTADFDGGTLEGTHRVVIGDGAVVLDGDVLVDGFELAVATGWEWWPASGDLSRTAAWQVIQGRLVHETSGDVPTYHPAVLTSDRSPGGDFTLECRQRVTQVGNGPGDIGVLGFVFGGVDPQSYWLLQYAQLGFGVRLYRRHAAGTFTLVAQANMPDPKIGRWYDLRVDVRGTNISLFIDGVSRLSVADPAYAPGRTGLLGYEGSRNEYDDVTVTTGVEQAGIYTSRVFDAGGQADWGPLSWSASVPSGTVVVMRARTGNTPVPDETWTPFGPALTSGVSIGSSSRYVQYRAILATVDPLVSPRLNEVQVAYAPR